MEWNTRLERESVKSCREDGKCLFYKIVNDICFIRLEGNELVVVNWGGRLRNWMKKILFFELVIKAAY